MKHETRKCSVTDEKLTATEKLSLHKPDLSRSFQICESASGKAQQPTAESRNDGTRRRLV
jgi:hypothetical protein